MLNNPSLNKYNFYLFFICVLFICSFFLTYTLYNFKSSLYSDYESLRDSLGNTKIDLKEENPLKEPLKSMQQNIEEQNSDLQHMDEYLLVLKQKIERIEKEVFKRNLEEAHNKLKKMGK